MVIRSETCHPRYLLLVLLCTKVIYSLAFTCNSDEFKCATEDKCVKKKFICDLDDDCSDKSDEVKCDYTRKCHSKTEFRCGNGRCILNEWKCDNFPDCLDRSDEITCKKENCTSGTFSCNNGYCLPNQFRCDYDKDCLDGEDEEDCVYNATCPSDKFQCRNISKCIDKTFQCDSNDDCGDNSDEQNCGKTCKPGSFACKSGNCIPENLRCNGKNDCSDGSDENQCPTVNVPKCFADEFTCLSGDCVSSTFKCDGEIDCADGSDEVSCGTITCPINSDFCDNKKCITKYKFCNGKDDCGDNSDESDARCVRSTTVPPTTEKICKTTEYKCNNVSKCIDQRKVCDQKQDCPHNDDETCSVNECQTNNGNCSQLCIDTNTSYYCSCKHGYRLKNDLKTCEDVNECKDYGLCSQQCTNIMGSYRCSCLPGYWLTHGKRCIVYGQMPKLVVATGMDIREFSIRGSSLSRVLGKSIKMVVAVGFYYKGKTMKIIWSDIFQKKIYVNATLPSGESGEAQVLVESTKAKSMSIDWVTGKIYWINATPTGSRIEVVDIESSQHTVLIKTKDKESHSIVVDPLRGYLYWTNPSIPSITRAKMDGTNATDIMTNSLSSPTGITIDFTTKKLFWLDSKRHTIESSDLDGSNRRTVISHDINHPHSIAVFEDNVYWSEPMGKRILSANKFTGKGRAVLTGHANINSYQPSGLFVNHPVIQPTVINRCKNNGGCSNLCLLIPRGHICACPDAGTLLADGKTCKMAVSSTTTPNKDEGKTSVNVNTKISSSSKKSVIGLSTSVIGGIVGGVVLLLVIFIIVAILYRREKNRRKMEVQYSSRLGVKIMPSESKDINREAYIKFANKNFKDDIIDDEDDDEDDITNVSERQPVLPRTSDDEIGGQIV